MNPIKKIRVSAGLSQSNFAKMLNVHQTAVSQWELGRTTPDVELAKRISELFGVSLDVILDNAPNANNTTKDKKPADSMADGLDIELLDMIEKLTPEQKSIIRAQIKGILSEK